jgi:cell division protein FtsB
MKWMVVTLGSVLLLLQFRLWISPDGMPGLLAMRRAVATQQAQNLELSRRNRQLLAEVRDLKQGFAAMEERARNDLGMVGEGETFYQIVAPSPAVTTQSPVPAVQTAAQR